MENTVQREFYDKKDSTALIYKVFDVNAITHHYYIEIAEFDLPLNSQ